MKILLKLQELDLRIEACRSREAEIPKQKKKFDIHRERLQGELAEREKVCQDLILEQKILELDIEQRQALIAKYSSQLNSVKKNDEYQALLHEIDQVKKQIALKEERILGIMEDLEQARARLQEDRKRIQDEFRQIDAQCAEIDSELEEAVRQRNALEAEGEPLIAGIPDDLMRRYNRIRANKRSGAAAVPLNGEVCGGCHMSLRPQIVNEVLAGIKTLACQHCGRLLYHPANFIEEHEPVSASKSR